MKAVKLLLFSLFLIPLLTTCKRDRTPDDNLYQFREYIAGHSTGRISIADPIRIDLAQTLGQYDLTQEIPAEYLIVKPKVSGKLVIEDGRNLFFIPDQHLKPDTEYSVTLRLDKFFDSLKKDLRRYRFSVKTIAPDFRIDLGQLQSYSKDWQHLSATLEASDVFDSTAVEKLVKVSQDKKDVRLRWENAAGNGKVFHFTIDSIRRFEDESELLISWDGKPVKSKAKGEYTYTIPGKNQFTIVDVKTAASPEAALQINFSDPLREQQDFSGLVHIENAEGLRFEVDGNMLYAYPPNRISGDVLVEISGVISAGGYRLREDFSEYISFEQLKPALRLISDGVILPQATSTPFHFEAVNLSAVDVRVIRIFEDNVLQYLQGDNLNSRGFHNLNRVGRRVAKKTISLDKEGMTDDGQWKAYGLDLSEFFKAGPGALYRVELNFKKEYSLYDCDAPVEEEEEDEEEDYYYELETADVAADEEAREVQYWDGRIYNWRRHAYNWRERDNPCHEAYYNEQRIVQTNLLGSDLGLIAKKGANHSYHFAANNLLTTEPEGDVHIRLYDYQQRQIAQFSTGADGMAKYDPMRPGGARPREAAFAVAEKNNHYAYLKLMDGSALSLSKFDVSGKQLQKGLKGFIYTERGVYRPGDSIHLTFVLNDLANPLPKGHPVSLAVNDARGKLVYKNVLNDAPETGAKNGFYHFPIPTDDTAPTGNWRATVHVGGAQFTEVIRVAAVKPNRLKIEMDFPEGVLDASRPITGTAKVSWLHGVPGRNLGIETQAVIRSSTTGFEKYPDYVFHDPVRRFDETEVEILKDKVNAKGHITINKKIDLGKTAPGMLRASFLTKAFEGGGDFSIDVFSKDLAPFSHFIGLRSPETRAYGNYFTGQKTTFDVATVDAQGRSTGNRKVDVKVFRIEWRWWWSRGEDNLSRYENATVHRPVREFTVTTDGNGKTNFDVEIPEGDNGRYLIRLIDTESGHATGRVAYFYRDWYGLGAGDPENAKMLVFASDKEKYQVGETATITFPSGSGGRALLSIENGTEVLQTRWVETQKGETRVQLPITADMAPNIYVNISLLQPHEQTANDLPIRLYGVIPLLVEDPATVLEPVISMPDILKPEEKFTVRVSEKAKKPMTYTLAIVDDGLLDLTRFRTPDIHGAFYTREALGVRTFDLYDYIIGAYSGNVENIYAIGGGDEAAGAKARKAERFKPVVMFLGPFELKAGETASHTLTMPNYVGSVRTMVVAGDHTKAAYGNAEKTTPVRKPLMTLVSLPRKLSPGEKLTLPVTVFAMEDKIKSARVEVKTSDGLRAVNGSRQNVSFSRPGEKIVNFEYEVQPHLGVQTVEVLVSGHGEQAGYEVEIDVVNPNPVTQKITDYTLDPNGSADTNFNTFGVAGTNTATVEFSTLPPMDYSGRLGYLIRYPHGCVEQVTSGAFPQLFLADIFDVTYDKKQEIQKNVEAAIRRLNNYQNPGGGIGYWPGEREADEWATNYVGHFMVEAKNKGYALPVTFLSSWLRYQQETARKWRPGARSWNTDQVQAYRLYTLALAGQPELAVMNRLRGQKELSNDAKWRLAAAYALAGQDRAAKELAASANIDFKPKKYDYYTYGSPFRNRAMALETTVLLGDEKQRELAQSLARELSSKRWLSTQETAMALLSMSKMVEKGGGKALELNYSQNGQKSDIKTSRAFAQRDLGLQMGENSLSLTNGRDNTVYVRLVQAGILPLGEELAEQRNLRVSTAFLDGEGETIDVRSLRQGTEVTLRVKIDNLTSDYVDNVALTQVLPSGWEIVNTSFTEHGGGASGPARYADLRDDRALFYFDLKGKGSKTFTVRVNASYLGRYYLPGTQAEAMYDNEYLSRNKGMWVEVTP